MKLMVASWLTFLSSYILSSCHTQEDRIIRYNDGNVKYRYHLVNHLQDGESISYYPNSQVKSIASWDKGKQSGKTYLYYTSGELQKISHWKAGILDGPFNSFHKNGKPAVLSTWKNGKKIGWDYEYSLSGVIKMKSISTSDSMRIVVLYNKKGSPIEKHIENSIGRLIYVASYDKEGREELGFIIPSYEGEKYYIKNKSILLDTLSLKNIHPIKMTFGFNFNKNTKLIISSSKHLDKNIDTLSTLIGKDGLYFLIKNFSKNIGINTIYYKFICAKCNDTLAAKIFFGGQIGSHSYFIKK